MEDEEYSQFLKFLEAEAKKVLSEKVDVINDFINFSASKGVILTSENFNYVETIGIVANYPNILELMDAELVKDKEGLVNYSLLLKRFKRHRFNSGYLCTDNFIFMAHPYFRRGYHPQSNFNPGFMDSFWRLDHSSVSSYLCLDFDRVRIDIDESALRERDAWYGPKFTKDIEAIEDDITKLAPPLDLSDSHIDSLFAGTYSLDIKWQTKGGIKSFQSEEFKADRYKIAKNGKEYYPVRYIHAEYDLSKQMFRHFDGAIHFYTADEYYQRRDSDFNYNNKSDHKIKTISEKLFKVNGDLDVDTWIEMSSHFMTGNPLVHEYFEGKFPEVISNYLTAIRNGRE